MAHAVLRSARLVLRPVSAADRESLRAILADPTVAAWWGTGSPDEAIDDVLAQPDFVTLVIDLDGTVAGAILYAEEADPDYRHAGIDIFLGAPFQGRGLGSEALRLLARYLFEERGHHRLTIDPAAGNERAIRTYAAAGFRPVGVMRRYERGRDGTFHDGLLMDLLADEPREPAP